MEKLQEISQLLANSETFGERRLGKQLGKPKIKKEILLGKKLYTIFLKSIDEESRKRLMELDSIINSISKEYMVNGGWHITNKGIFSESSKPVQVRDQEGKEQTVYTFEMPRTEEGYVQQDYIPDTVELRVIRETEKRFLEEAATDLERIHEAFNTKSTILSSGEYSVLPGRQEIVAAIEKVFGYNQPQVETIKK